MARKSKRIRLRFRCRLQDALSRAPGDLGLMLRHVGGKVATKSARMSQHRRQGANPRVFELLAGTWEWRDHLMGVCIVCSCLHLCPCLC